MLSCILLHDIVYVYLCLYVFVCVYVWTYLLTCVYVYMCVCIIIILTIYKVTSSCSGKIPRAKKFKTHRCSVLSLLMVTITILKMDSIDSDFTTLNTNVID